MLEAAADSIGLETAITWDFVFKVCTLMLVTAFGIVVSGFAVSDIANELIGFFADYEDVNGQEADKKTDSSEKYPDGSAAENDLLYHMATTFYSFMVLAGIGIGGFVFMVQLNPFEETLL